MTLAEFRDYLATSIGIKGRGNALAAEDANHLETVIENCQAELEQLGVALWSTDNIPAYAIEGLVVYCRGALSRFGFDPDPAIKAMGLMQLRYLTADPLTGPGKADYF
jgi:hypothetical protein